MSLDHPYSRELTLMYLVSELAPDRITELVEDYPVQDAAHFREFAQSIVERYTSALPKPPPEDYDDEYDGPRFAYRENHCDDVTDAPRDVSGHEIIVALINAMSSAVGPDNTFHRFQFAVFLMAKGCKVNPGNASLERVESACNAQINQCLNEAGLLTTAADETRVSACNGENDEQNEEGRTFLDCAAARRRLWLAMKSMNCKHYARWHRVCRRERQLGVLA